MNTWVRIAFMPIMLVAGVIVGGMCALIVAPIALWHRIRQIQATRVDLERFHGYASQVHQSFYGAAESAESKDNSPTHPLDNANAAGCADAPDHPNA